MDLNRNRSKITVRMNMITKDIILSDQMQKEIIRTVQDIWQTIIPKTPHFVDGIDLVQEGYTAQMTPLVTDKGVVIKLDVEDSLCFVEAFWNEQESKRFYSLVMHEIWHFADRLNPDFAINFHEEVVCDYIKKYRKRVNAAWDIYIERRKWKERNVIPLNWFKNQNKSHKDAAIDAALAYLHISKQSTPNETELYFRSIWDTNKNYTWKDFYNFAKEIVNP